MYTRPYAEEEMRERQTAPPPQYDGHLFSTSAKHLEEDIEGAEEAEETVSASSLLHTSPPKKTGIGHIFTDLLGKNPLKGILQSDLLLTAAAVWLLCNDNEEDDFLFIILLFFLFK